MTRNLRSPLSYLGVKSPTPPNFTIQTRAPLSSDYKEFKLGDIWLQKETANIWVLTDKQAGVATWTLLNNSGSATFTDVTITTGDLTLESGGIVIKAINFNSTLRTLSDGTVYGLPDPGVPGPGEAIVYHSNDSGVVQFGDLTSSGGTVTITNTINGINLEAAGGTASNTFTADDGFAVSPDGAGNINVIGGTNITTVGAVANEITFNLYDTIMLAGDITAENGTFNQDVNIIGDLSLTGNFTSYLDFNTQSGTAYTLQLSDAGKEIRFTSPSAVTLNIPTNASVAFPVGTVILL